MSRWVGCWSTACAAALSCQLQALRAREEKKGRKRGHRLRGKVSGFKKNDELDGQTNTPCTVFTQTMKIQNSTSDRAENL